MEQTFIGMLRVKNEGLWIQKCLSSVQGLCESIYVLNDHSTDGTAVLASEFPSVTCFDSPFSGLDETRDKNWLLERIVERLPAEMLNGESPYWILCIDGDEALATEADAEAVRKNTDNREQAYSLQVLYLWNDEKHVRVDGVYGTFWRPSLFRMINPGFKFQTTGNGGNLHCSNIPQEFLGHAKPHAVEDGDSYRGTRLLHYGYMCRADRVRKFAWYNRVDPGNKTEDYYRHIIQGDGRVELGDSAVVQIEGAEVRAISQGAQERLKWAGPLTIVELESF